MLPLKILGRVGVQKSDGYLRKKREERFMEVGGGLKIDLEEWG